MSLTFCLRTALSWEVSRRDVPSPALDIITKQLLRHTSLVKALERIFAWQVALQVFTWQAASVQGGISRARVCCWCLRLVNFRQSEELVSWVTHGSGVRWWGNFCFPHYTFLLQVRPKASWIEFPEMTPNLTPAKFLLKSVVYSELHIWALVRDYFAHWCNSCLHGQNYFAELVLLWGQINRVKCSFHSRGIPFCSGKAALTDFTVVLFTF